MFFVNFLNNIMEEKKQVYKEIDNICKKETISASNTSGLSITEMASVTQRPGMTMEKLQNLPAAFVPKTGNVTAGNASGINDGSIGMIIMSADKAKELGLNPIAKIKATGMGACHPTIMGISPVPAVKSLMDKSGLAMLLLYQVLSCQVLSCQALSLSC